MKTIICKVQQMRWLPKQKVELELDKDYKFTDFQPSFKGEIALGHTYFKEIDGKEVHYFTKEGENPKVIVADDLQYQFWKDLYYRPALFIGI